MTIHSLTMFSRWPFLILILLGALGMAPANTQAITNSKTRRTKKAVEPKPLLEKALLELNKASQKQPVGTSKSNASGIFTTKEPELFLTARPFQYQLGIKVQSLQPLGTVNSPIVGDFHLNQYQSLTFPMIEGGISKNFQTPSFFSHWGLLGQFGYSSVKVPLIFASGYRASESTHLNVLRAGLITEFQRPLTKYPLLFLSSGLGMGKLFYTQTSYNDLAQFSESLPFVAAHVGAIYDQFFPLKLTAHYVYRQGLFRSDLQLQKHNLELGLQIRW